MKERRSGDQGRLPREIRRSRQDDPSLDAAGGMVAPRSDFLYSLVEDLARSVEAHSAWVAAAVSTDEPRLRTLALSIGGQDAANLEYSATGSPAQTAFTNSGICRISSDVQKRFPGDLVLRDFDASGYAGVPLLDSTGAVLGLLAVTSRGPLPSTRLLASKMRTCANRATAELERRKAEAAVRANETRLKLIFEHAPDAYLVLTLDGKLLQANRSAERLTGFTRAEMVGRSVLLPGLMPEEEIRRVATRMRARAEGAPPSLEEFTLLHRNGSKVFTETCSELATVDGVQVMLLSVRDIGSRKIAQQERQNQIDRIQQLQHAALTLAAHDSITRGDVRQIAAHVTRMMCGLIGAIAVSIWLFRGETDEIRCLDRFEATSGAHSGGEVIVSGKCARYRAELQESPVIIITNICSDALSREPERVRAISAGTEGVLEAGIRSGSRIAGVLRIEHLYGDARDRQPEEVEFVATVANLVGHAFSNADRAGAEEALRKSQARLALIQRVAALGTWERDLTTGKMEWSPEALRIYGVDKDCFVPAGQFFRDHVHADDLPKIDSAIDALLLTGEPCQVRFRIILPDGSLRLVRELIEIERNPSGEPVRLAGTVQEIAEMGNLIFPPGSEAEQSAAEEYTGTKQKVRGNATILLVEDQPEVRTLTRSALENLGYRVLSAADGDAALRLSSECRAPIDLLLTDMTMPGLEGGELADRLSQLRPSLKVLFMSGYTTHTSIRKDDARRGRGFIAKPFDPLVLADKIRCLLSSAVA